MRGRIEFQYRCGLPNEGAASVKRCDVNAQPGNGIYVRPCSSSLCKPALGGPLLCRKHANESEEPLIVSCPPIQHLECIARGDWLLVVVIGPLFSLPPATPADETDNGTRRNGNME